MDIVPSGDDAINSPVQELELFFGGYELNFIVVP
jgi:hypothetical protein